MNFCVFCGKPLCRENKSGRCIRHNRKRGCTTCGGLVNKSKSGLCISCNGKIQIKKAYVKHAENARKLREINRIRREAGINPTPNDEPAGGLDELRRR